MLITQEIITPGEIHCHLLREVITEIQDGNQIIQIAETEAYGRGLFIDGRIQHVAADEYIYSESMIHPAAVALGDRCRRVLIAGSGPGGVIREVVKHRSVQKVRQVEISPQILKLSREYFPHITSGYPEDSRVQIIVGDIRDHLMGSESWDLIVFDLSEPASGSPAEDLFESHWLQAVKRVLRPGGAFVTWAGSAGPCSHTFAATLVALLERIFHAVVVGLSHMQSYGTSWLTAIASDVDLQIANSSPEEIDQYIARQVHGPLRLYDGFTHRHMFNLPKDVRNFLSDAKKRLAGREVRPKAVHTSAELERI
jgi:spermidine synthase